MDFRYQADDEIKTVHIEREGDHYRVQIDNKSYLVQVRQAQSGEWTLAIDEQIVHGYTAQSGDQHYIAFNKQLYTLVTAEEASHSKRSAARGEGHLTAPMPGQVTKILITEGDSVTKGQTLILMEAMKMEIRITAPQDTKIQKLLCTQGQIVERGQRLVELG